MKHSVFTVSMVLLFSATASAQNSPEGSAPRSLTDQLAAARARAEAAALAVKRIAVSPAILELSQGDSINSNDLWSRLSIVGLTASGDSVYEFAKFLALRPNDFLEQQGTLLIARRRGTATLWIYIGLDPNRRFFTDSEYAERVRIIIK